VFAVATEEVLETVVEKDVPTWEEMKRSYDEYSYGYRSAKVDSETKGFIGAEKIEGEIPKELVGTLLRNGPALFERDGPDGKVSRAYLDGDGMVTSLAFKDGEVYFRNKFIRTESFNREEAAGKFTDMSIFSAEDPRQPAALFRFRDDIIFGPPSPKSGANYNVVNWAGSLNAIDWGTPHGLSDELEYEGAREGDEFSQAKYTAHYRILTEEDGSKRMVTFEPKVDWAKGITTTTFKEFDEAGKCVSSKSHVFPATYFHDMIVTENFYVLFDCPVKMDYFKTFIGYIASMNSLGETIVEDLGKRGVFRIFPRKDTGFEPMVIEADPIPAFAFHHINGYDLVKEGQDTLVFETCTWDRMCLYFNDIIKADGEKHWPRTKLSRFSIDLKAQSCERTIISENPFEYPTVAQSETGKKHKYAYAVGSNKTIYDPVKGRVDGPLQNIVKLTYTYEDDNVTVKNLNENIWCPGEHKYAMEPLFVPRPGSKAEDDGWVIAPIFNGETKGSEVVILDASNWGKVVANITLPIYQPFGVHGSFSDQYVCGPAKQ